MMFKVCIIDDEIDSRILLRELLDEIKEITVIGEASSSEDGIQLLSHTKPDLVFLDINRRDGSGFDVLKAVNRTNLGVIFITAYDQFALNAFKANAIDYLLKPIDKVDLLNAVTKFKDIHSFKKSIQIDNLIQNHIAKIIDKLVISTSDSTYYIPIHEILYLHSEGNYTTIYTNQGLKLLTSKHLGDFEYLLDCGLFFRTHQSYMININHVVKTHKSNDGDFAILNNNSSIPISRRKKEEFILFMNLKGNMSR